MVTTSFHDFVLVYVFPFYGILNWILLMKMGSCIFRVCKGEWFPRPLGASALV